MWIIVVPTIRSDHRSIVLNQRFAVYRTTRWRQIFYSTWLQSTELFFYLGGRLHVHVPLRYTKARSLHLACLKTLPTARGFAMIGCRLSRHWILTFTSLAESSSTIFHRSNTNEQHFTNFSHFAFLFITKYLFCSLLYNNYNLDCRARRRNENYVSYVFNSS